MSELNTLETQVLTLFMPPCDVSTRRGGALRIAIKLHKPTEVTTQIDVSFFTRVGNIAAVNSWSVNAENGGISG
jgi:hypothetical protein